MEKDPYECDELRKYLTRSEWESYISAILRNDTKRKQEIERKIKKRMLREQEKML